MPGTKIWACFQRLLVWELVQWLQGIVSGLLNVVYTKGNVFRGMSPDLYTKQVMSPHETPDRLPHYWYQLKVAEELSCEQAHREGGGTGDTSPGPPNFWRAPWGFYFMIFTFMGSIFTLFLYLSHSRHCLDSMSECLGRIISNAFTVSVNTSHR